MVIVASIIAAYLLMLVTWLFYLASMNLIEYRNQMHPVAKFHAYIIAGITIVIDIILNWIIGSIVFLEVPREFMLTKRLKRLKKEDGTYRKKIATWVCKHLLNQFDPRGKHC